MAKIKVIVFDSNETLLDLAALDPEFKRIFGRAEVRRQWFKQLLELFLTATIVDEYRSFERLADSALEMVADWSRVELGKDDKARVHAAMLELPPHPDVTGALERLRGAGFRLAVLTNSTKKSATAQMKHAHLDQYFDEILSADDVKRYKPAAEAYEHAANKLDVKPKEIRLVAAHAWDISGALAAECKAAFVQRAEKALDPDGAQPDVRGTTLGEVAESIIREDR